MGHRNNDEQCKDKKDCKDNGCSSKTALIAGASTVVALLFIYLAVAGTMNFVTFLNAPLIGDGSRLAGIQAKLVEVRAHEYLVNIYIGLLALVFSLIAFIKLVTGIKDNHHNRKRYQTIGLLLVYMIVLAISLLIIINGIAARGNHIAGWIALFAGIVGAIATVFINWRWQGVLMAIATLLTFALATYILVVQPTEAYIVNRVRA